MAKVYVYLVCNFSCILNAIGIGFIIGSSML